VIPSYVTDVMRSNKRRYISRSPLFAVQDQQDPTYDAYDVDIGITSLTSENNLNSNFFLNFSMLLKCRSQKQINKRIKQFLFQLLSISSLRLQPSFSLVIRRQWPWSISSQISEEFWDCSSDSGEKHSNFFFVFPFN
jgi:hypothetical protein